MQSLLRLRRRMPPKRSTERSTSCCTAVMVSIIDAFTLHRVPPCVPELVGDGGFRPSTLYMDMGWPKGARRPV